MILDSSIKNLTAKKILDPETGVSYFHYYWKRNKVPKVEITGKLPNKLSGLTLIKKDLDSSLKWVRLAKSLIDMDDIRGGHSLSKDREIFDQVKALFVASLTFYGKCFTEANGRSAQVSRNWLDEEHKKLHDYYMSYRHNFAAHSGDEKVELARTFVLLHPKKKNELLPYLPTVRLQPDILLTSDDKNGFEELIINVSEIVDEKYNKLAKKIIDELVMKKDIAFWREKAKSNKSVELGLPKKRS